MAPRALAYACVLLALVMGCTKARGPEPDCNINAGPCSRDAPDGLTLELSLTPVPVRAMRELEFEVAVSDVAGPVAGASVELDFTMPGMYMGVNRYTLEHSEDGLYRAEGVLPRCPQGGRLWMAEAVVMREGRGPVSANFLFEVD